MTDLLPVRFKPQTDELFSSWMVRLAWGNTQKLTTFCRTIVGLGDPFLHFDMDRRSDRSMTTKIAIKTGTSPEIAFSTALASLEGRLYEHHSLNGPQRWLLPIGRHSRTHTLHGQQYCAECLASDLMPYFRKKWRLSLSVVCERHGVMLRDCCPACGASISFHEGDFKRWKFREFVSLEFCRNCGTDLKSETGSSIVALPELLMFQKNLYKILETNDPILGEGHPAFPHLFFNGLHCILRVLASNSHTRVLRDFLIQARGAACSDTPFRTRHMRFEELRTADRLTLIELALPLLVPWPEIFVKECRAAKLSSTYILDYKEPLPYWLESTVRQHLDGTPYRPCKTEKEAIRTYLRKNQMQDSQNNLRRWLGQHFTSKNHY